MLHNVHVHGATLSSMLQCLAQGGRDFDGLLLGQFQTRTQTRYEDDESDAVVTEEHQAIITAAVCCAATCSFYDAAGNIKEEELTRLLPPHVQDPVIGWLSYRAGTPLQPSMREAAVTCSLYSRAAASHAQQQQRPQHKPARLPPCLLLVASSSKNDHGGATLTFEYRLFQAGCPSDQQLQQALATSATTASGASPHQHASVPIRLQPVELLVDNLARSLGHHAQYKSFQPSMQLPRAVQAAVSPAAAGTGTAGAGAGTSAPAASLEAAAASTGQQVAALEAHYDALLRQLTALTKQVSEGATAAAVVEAENQQLFKELHDLEASCQG